MDISDEPVKKQVILRSLITGKKELHISHSQKIQDPAVTEHFELDKDNAKHITYKGEPQQMKNSNVKCVLSNEKSRDVSNSNTILIMQPKDQCLDGLITNDVKIGDVLFEDHLLKNNESDLCMPVTSQEVRLEREENDVMEHISLENGNLICIEKPGMIGCKKWDVLSVDSNISHAGNANNLYEMNSTVIPPNSAVSSCTLPRSIIPGTKEAFEGVCDSAEQMTEESNISSEIKESDDVDSGKKKDVAYDIKILPNAEKLICCKICSYTTTKDRNWYKHKRSHLDLRNYSCTTCSYRATTASNLRRHMEIHVNSRPFSCSQCSQKFRQKIHLQRHIIYKHESNRVKCTECDYRCPSGSTDLRMHLKRKHKKDVTEILQYVCGKCEFIAYKEKDLKQHMKFHRPGPEVKLFCEYCSFVTDCRSRLTRHLLTHTKVKPHSCPECSYCARQKEHLQRHMQVKHNLSHSTSDTVFSKQKIQPTFNEKSKQLNRKYAPCDFSHIEKAFSCMHCNLKFVKAINLFKHLQGQHGVEFSKERGWICVVCTYNAPNKQSLLVHMRQHNAARLHKKHLVKGDTCLYMCAECNHIDQDRETLVAHVMKHHGEDNQAQPDSTIVTVSTCYDQDLDAANLVSTITSELNDTVNEIQLCEVTDSQEQPEKTNDTSMLCLPVEPGTILQTENRNVYKNTDVDALKEESHIVDQLDANEDISDIKENSTSMQLTEEQLSQLADADLVLINGETYQVKLLKS